ncbi:MAG: hypothetical protein ACXVRK_12385 [Gaiellaceae bacterium]
MATDQGAYERVFAEAIAHKLHHRGRREYRCVSCGFPAFSEMPPARCPECGDVAWHVILTHCAAASATTR